MTADELIAGAAGGRVVVLTGAGLSAESGVPTFRGPEGYWTVGSTNYHPQEMATLAAFRRMPDEVWKWYLYRRGVCRAAAPNAGHRACAELEARLGERFTLITQNVDGLHLRAGSTLARTYQIHGNVDFMRCGDDCTPEQWPLPDEPAELVCPRCGARARPHVLWFDECYDEPRFRFDSSIRAATGADVLIVVGTSASTTLPWHVVEIAARRGAVVVDINVEDNPFAAIARGLPRGAALTGTAGTLLPPLLAAIA